jgi:hypothetical protein
MSLVFVEPSHPIMQTRQFSQSSGGAPRTTRRLALGPWRGCTTRVAGRVTVRAQTPRIAESGDRDLVWIARENLRKRQLERFDAGWVGALRARLG